MKYPSAMNVILQDVREIVDAWSVKIAFENVIKWMMQFEMQDMDLAFRIIKNLNVIGYDELKSALSIAYSKLERKSIDKGTQISSTNTLFAGIGEGGKSGAMIGYSFRIINDLSEENFLDDSSMDHLQKGRIENIVLVDDIISSGKQATEEIKALTETLVPLGVKNFFLLTAIGMKEGIKKIEKETGAYVFSAFEYDINDTINSFDSAFYEGLDFENRRLLKEKLEYYGRVANPRMPIGYAGVGGLIAFYYNTPNSTIPLVWGSSNSWIPLFKRTLRINGIDAYYKQIDKLESKKPKAKKDKEEIKLFVEGKTIETFLEILYPELKEQLGYDKITIIPIGGAFSPKLIENLNKADARYVFVLEDDALAPPSYKKKIENTFKGIAHIIIHPILEYLNLESLIADEDFVKMFKLPLGTADLTSRGVKREIELRIFRLSNLSTREPLLVGLIKKHLNQERIGTLLKEIKAHIK